MVEYNPKDIDKALKRMEDADNLKNIHRSKTNIMSFFDENDKEHNLQKQQSAADIKKEEYLKNIKVLQKLLAETGTISEKKRIQYIGILIESTDFLNLKPDRKKMVKENMIWCNKVYNKYQK